MSVERIERFIPVFKHLLHFHNSVFVYALDDVIRFIAECAVNILKRSYGRLLV